MKEELSIPLRPGIRRLARTLGISAAIYSFLRLTFIGELVWDALAQRRRSEPSDSPIAEPVVGIAEPVVDGE